MDHGLLEKIARQVFERTGELSEDVRTALTRLPDTDRAAVLAFGQRLALAGPGAGSLPQPRGVESWV
ncbi:MAG TPA: hypothetical protein VHL09_05620 [Dehalococcoidia bacterium]|nr:hypothetical protein [Dehalococcoidia bacterium]